MMKSADFVSHCREHGIIYRCQAKALENLFELAKPLCMEVDAGIFASFPDVAPVDVRVIFDDSISDAEVIFNKCHEIWSDDSLEISAYAYPVSFSMQNSWVLEHLGEISPSISLEDEDDHSEYHGKRIRIT